MEIIKEEILEGKNIFSNKDVIKMYIDFKGYSTTPTKDILNFQFNILNIIEQIKKHKDDINIKDVFLMDLKDTYEYIVNNLEDRFNLNNKIKERKDIKEEIYFTVIEYEDGYKNVTMQIYKLAKDLINSLIKDEIINIEDRLKKIKNLKTREVIEPSIKAMINKAIEKNMPVIKLGEKDFYQIGYGKNGKLLDDTLGGKTTSISVRLSHDKLLVSRILKDQYIPVIDKRKIIDANNILELSKEIGYPIVLKNQYENRANSTVINIRDDKSLLNAYKVMDRKYDDVILEKHINGKSFRVCVIDYKVVGVALRIRPFVIGDGKKSLKELIKNLNNDERRSEVSNKLFNKIKIDEELLNCIEKQGLNISSIVLKEEKVYLRENANISFGGTSEDFTDILSEENREICENVAKVLRLDVCGIDIITEDISKSLNKQGNIIDVIASPNIIIHESYYKDKNISVCDAILNMMYENYVKNIPVVSVLDASDIITKGINYVMARMGYVVGAKVGNNLIIDNKCVNMKNNNEKINTKSILLNKDVDVAILDRTKEEIISDGLGYDLCDVAIVTKCNVLNKEYALDDFDIAELLVLNSIKDEGFLVVNADKFNNLEGFKKVKNKKIFFSMDGESEILKDSIVLGSAIVYIDNEIMYVENNKKKYMICKVKDIPIITKDNSEECIQNAMAICAGLVGLKVDYCMIAKGLKNFENELI